MLLKLHMDENSTYGSDEEIAAQISANLARGLPEFKSALCVNDGHFVVVGSGPSLPLFIDEIKEERLKGRPICAVKGAHDLLCEHDLEPDLFVSVDPRPRHENIRMANSRTIYVLASRCHPEMFETLKDRKIVVFHAYSEREECKTWLKEGKVGVGGGTTSGLRAVTIGTILGFHKFILYGMDSCLANDKMTKRFTGEKAGQIIDIKVGREDAQRTFYANAALAQQANEFQDHYKFIPGIEFEIKGDGLLAAIVEERRRVGKRV